MNTKLDLKKQIIILTSITVVMIIIAIIISKYDSPNEVSKNVTSSETESEYKIEGLNERQLDNMKGLLEDNVYDEYKSAFDSGNTQTNENADYITEEEKEDLDNDLKEALELYGNDSNLNQE